MEGAAKEVAAEVHVVEVATELEKMEVVEAPAAALGGAGGTDGGGEDAEEEKAMRAWRGRGRWRRHGEETPRILNSLCTATKAVIIEVIWAPGEACLHVKSFGTPHVHRRWSWRW